MDRTNPNRCFQLFIGNDVYGAARRNAAERRGDASGDGRGEASTVMKELKSWFDYRGGLAVVRITSTMPKS